MTREDPAYPTLLDYARECFTACTFHTERFGRAGLDGLDKITDFSMVPFLTSAEVSAAGPDALLPDDTRSAILNNELAQLGTADRLVRISQTSSSSGGPPKLSIYTNADWEEYRDTLPVMMASVPSGDYSRIFNCFASTHSAGRFINDAFPLYGSIVLNRHHTATTPEDVITQITNGFASFGGFNCLAAPPWSPGAVSKGASVAELLDHDFDNVIGKTSRTVITAGATTSGSFDLREALDDATSTAGKPPISICEWYGAAEVGIAAISCEHGHLHFTGGPVFGEVVEPETGQEVGEGERGIVVVTATRHGSRYLRYVIGDEADVTYRPCDCGRTTPRISRIERFEDHVRLQRGCAAVEVVQ